MESAVVLSMGAIGSNPGGVPVGVVGLDLDFPTRKISKNVGVAARGDFFVELREDDAKSAGDGLEWAGGRK
jgi:hypothetical protein